jgi:hypothetical protein
MLKDIGLVSYYNTVLRDDKEDFMLVVAVKRGLVNR